MEIKRKLELKDAAYDITGLTHEQFVLLVKCYEKQMYIYRNCPIDKDDELYDKMEKMLNSGVTIIK